jgi:RNA polymerase sigma factor (sigma-70 family)
LDEKIGEKDEKDFCSFVSNSGPLQDKLVEDKLFKEHIREILEKKLDSREFEIIRLRFLESKTLEEVGKEFNLSGERIRQIEEKTLIKLRKDKVLRELWD